MIIVAMSDDDTVTPIVKRLEQWSAGGLIAPVVIARAPDGSTDVGSLVIQRLGDGSLTDVPLNDLLESLTAPPTLVRVSTVSGESPMVSLGDGAGLLLYQALARVLEQLNDMPRLWAIFGDRPDTHFPASGSGGWPHRVLYAAEDRRAPEIPVASLNPAHFAAHVAAGIAALCSLWKVQDGKEDGGAVRWILNGDQGGLADMVWMARQFTRILEFPLLVDDLLQGTSLDPAAYPNPSQESFERVVLGDRLTPIAKSFVDHFAELQLGKPDLIAQDQEEIIGILEKMRRLWRYVLTQIALRPAQLADGILGGFYDRTARLLEGKYPEAGVRVIQWREIGKDPKRDQAAAEQIAAGSNVLNEGDLSHVWSPYLQASFSLLDGSEGEGSDLLKNHLYLTTERRQLIAIGPIEVAIDPWLEELNPILATPPVSEGSTSLEDQKPSSGTVSTEVAPTGDAPAVPMPPDFSFTGQVRSLINAARETAASAVKTIEAERAKASESQDQEGGAPATDRRSKTVRRAARSVRLTLLVILIAIGVTTYLGYFSPNHQPVLTTLILLGILAASPFLLILAALRGWRFQQRHLAEQQAEALKKVNGIIAEAHLRVAEVRLQRRLDEIDDWNAIIGMVVHHPLALPSAEETLNGPVADLGLPASVMRGTVVTEQRKIESLQQRFVVTLYRRGWLRERFLELERAAVPRILALSGPDDEQTLRSIEGDTSKDPQSPRRRLKVIIDQELRSQDAAPIIRRLGDFLKERPLTDLADGVNVTLPNGEHLSFSTDNFLSLESLQFGTVLPSHWEVNGPSQRGAVVDTRTVGTHEHVNVELLQDGVRTIPRITVTRLDRTDKIATEQILLLNPPQS